MRSVLALSGLILIFLFGVKKRMADKRIKVLFEAGMEAGEVKKTLQQVNNLLESTEVKLSKTASTSLSRLVNTLKTELNKIEGFDKMEVDSKQIKQITTSYEKVESSAKQIKVILRDISKDAGIDASKFFPEAITDKIKAANKALKEYKEAIKKGPETEEYQAAKEKRRQSKAKVQGLTRRIDTQIRNQQTAEEKKRQAQSKQEEAKANKERAKTQLDSANAKIEQAKKENKTLEQQRRIQEKISNLKARENKHAERADKVSEKMRASKRTDTKAYAELENSYKYNVEKIEELKKQREELEQQYEAAQTAAERLAQAETERTAAKAKFDTAEKEEKHPHTLPQKSGPGHPWQCICIKAHS